MTLPRLKFWVLLAGLLPLLASPAAAEDNRPNIVFIFADDLGWGDLGVYGHNRIRTPHLDALAEKGILFTDFHVASGVCSPSRAAVMTGRFPASDRVHGHFATPRNNAARGMPDYLDPAVPTFTRLLQSAGYRVGHYGKWHLGYGEDAPEPFAYGIDETRITSGNGPKFPFGDAAGPEFVPGLRHRSSEMIITDSIEFVERHAGEPFYVNVWFNDPHSTLDPSEEQLMEYGGLRPADVREKHAGAMAIYYSVVTDMDRQVGRLLTRLDELGLRDNTLIVFSSDNGPEDIHIINSSHSGVGSAGPFRGRKRSLYSGGVRVPFIVSWPAQQSATGMVNNTSVLSAVDLFPSFCAAAGVKIPAVIAEHLDGENVIDVLRGATRDRERPLHWEWRYRYVGSSLHWSPALATYHDGWKLLMEPDGSRMELYRFRKDPAEMQNLATAHPEVVRKLKEPLLDWHKNLPDSDWVRNYQPQSYSWPQ